MVDPNGTDGTDGSDPAEAGSGPGTPAPPPGFADYSAYAPASVEPPSVPVAPKATASAQPPRKRRWPLVVIALLVIGVVVGVVLQRGGDSGSGSDPTSGGTVAVGPGSPGAVYTAWVEAVHRDDLDRACKLVTQTTLDEAEARTTTCQALVTEAADEIGVPDGAEGSIEVVVTDESITGDRAQVRVEIDGEESPTAALVREAGVWKVELLGAQEPADGSIRDEAVTATCETNRQAVMTAVETYTTLEGEPPASIDVLVGDYLREAPTGIEYTPETGIQLVGVCA